MRAAVLLFASLVACGSSSSGQRDGGADDDAGASCSPFASRECDGQSLYWLDSCGERGELADECLAPQQCSPLASECCLAPSTGVVARTNIVATVDWKYAEPGDRLSMRFSVAAEGGSYGLLATAQFVLGGDTFWIGPQYPLSNGDPGLLLSRLSYGDGPSDIELTSTTAYVESAPMGSGDYIGLRQPFPFAPGNYRIDMIRGEGVSGADWFDISIAVLATDEVIDIGRIKAVRVTPMSVVTVPAAFTTTLDLYGYAVPAMVGDPPQRNNQDALYSDVPTWAWELWYQVGGQDPSSVTSGYNLDDGGNDFDNLEVQGRTDHIFVALGADVGRCTAAGELISSP